MHGRMDGGGGPEDAWMDGRMDGWMYRCTCVCIKMYAYSLYNINQLWGDKCVNIDTIRS